MNPLIAIMEPTAPRRHLELAYLFVHETGLRLRACFYVCLWWA